jgi:xylose isomerase
MEPRYSVFLANVGHCSDRYCPQYSEPFSVEELFARASSIDRLSGVDLVAAPGLLAEMDTVRRCVKDTGLTVVSIAADTFTEARWRKGSFSSSDSAVRQAAVDHAMEVMDLCAELGSDLLTLWPGQDGYDYLFQADYIAARQWFVECVAKLCQARPEMRVGLEYKAKEPRTHSYVNTVGTTVLMAKATGCDNCGVILDYGHALLGYESPAESVAILKQFGDMLLHVHINDNYRYWDDDMIVGSVRTLEYLEFFYWLERTGYEGWLTIDQFPYREDGRDAVAESAEWMAALQQRVADADRERIEAVLRSGDAVEASRLMRSLWLGS